MQMRSNLGRAKAVTSSQPAPIGGWNVRDALAVMKPTEAVSMENWWPTPVDVQVRKGYVNWATGLPGTVDTIMAYNGPTGAKKLFAITSTGSLYDVSSQGAVGAPIITGLSNGQWQYVAFTTPGGNFLLACNGLDSMLRYNGTNWVSVLGSATGATISTLTGNGTTSTVTTATPHNLQTGNTVTVTGASVAGFNVGPVAITRTGANTFTYPSTGTPSATGASYTVGEVITGVNPANIWNINIFKSRIWLVQKNSLSAWYLPSLAIQGAAVEFPMGSLFPAGGGLNAMGTWTIDVGVGIDDNAAFFSSEGEILVYKGTDPASASTFALVGLFKQGNPIGLRCQIKYLGDVFVITDLGVAPMSESILTAQVTMKSALTDKILPAMAAAVAQSRNTFGWQMVTYPAQNMLLINVPFSGGNYQFAMNTITGAFAKFTGWEAQCWETQDASLYFGGTGIVGLAWSSNTDAGNPIVADTLQAFNYFGTGTQTKKPTMLRPIFYSDGVPAVSIGVNFDYDQLSQPTGTLNFTAPSGMTWGSMTWGSMTWGGTLVVNKNWQFASGLGYSMAIRVRVSNNNAELRWASTDWVFERGGVLS